jgi:hypothetical protein
MFGGGLLGSGALLGLAADGAQAATKGDISILNFALTLEYLEAEFYRQAVANGALSGTTAQFAALVAGDELAHVKALQKALGKKAVGSPKFDFKNTVTDQPTFVKTAFVLENIGVHAYLGQAGKIKTPAILGAAASILTVEARHAAAIAMIAQLDNPTGAGGITPDGAFDVPLSKAKILAAVKQTGFVVG